jgi:Spy/CpxP family protein refolding chaperone
MRLSHRAKNVLLLASLAFNFGVCLAFGMQTYARGERPSPGRERDGERGDTRDRGPRRDMRDMKEQLGLTAEQRKAFSASKDRMFDAMRDQWGVLRAESEALTELIVAPELDREAIAAQTEKVAALRATIHSGFIVHYLELRDLLGPDQIGAFSEMVRDRCSARGKPFQGPGNGEEHWKSRRGRHGPRPDDGG